MTQQEIINRVRALTRDFNGSIYRENDILMFINEGIDRMSVIPELKTLSYPTTKTEQIKLIPVHYQYLLALYASSRCLFQDEQDYRAGSIMNEFETKLEELTIKIADGTIVITDENGNPVTPSYVDDAITDVYFIHTSDDDEIPM